MKGRDLIIHILKNKLEDEELLTPGTSLTLQSEKEVASKLSVGVASVKAFVDLGVLSGVEENGKMYFIHTSPVNKKE